MKVVTTKKLHLFSGRHSEELTKQVADHLGVEITEANLTQFSSGESHCQFEESVRGSDVFILQTHAEANGRSVNEAIMEHLIMVDAARRASAKRITAVMPYYGYGRQDRKAEGREPITAKLLADMFKVAGASRLISVDLHTGQIQGFFDGPVDHLTAMPVLIDYLRNYSDDLVIVSPDAGRVKVADRYAQTLEAGLAIVQKKRIKGVKNSAQAVSVVGKVKGKTCVIIDDMIDTAGTICEGGELLMKKGADSVIAIATHAVFSGPAVDRLKNSKFSKVVVTDTCPIPDEKQFDKLEVLSISQILADAVTAVFQDTSVSEIFDGQHLS